MDGKKCVIYTSLTGNYDQLPQYGALDSSFDYICFTNDLPENSKIGHWLIKSIPSSNNLDNIRLSRYSKIIPFQLLKDYEYSLWVDANVEIVNNDFYVHLKKMMAKGCVMACINHPVHRCIYDDARQCIIDGRDYAWRIMRQVHHLRAQKYPAGNGLYENNVILRKHGTHLMKKVSEMWWEEFTKYSKRDQLSLCYVLWKCNFIPDLLLPSNLNTSNSPFFKRMKHTRPVILRFKTLITRIINRLYMLGRCV